MSVVVDEDDDDADVVADADVDGAAAAAAMTADLMSDSIKCADEMCDSSLDYVLFKKKKKTLISVN